MLSDRKIQSLIKARNIFETFRQGMVDDRDRAGAIQAFEFCCELSWKTMKQILQEWGVESGSPRDTIRKAAIEGLIDSPERWFGFLEKRNLAAHTYEPKTMTDIIAAFDDFSEAMDQFLAALSAYLP